MDMLKTALFGIALLAGAVSPALAFENFIPAGTGYSTGVDSLPELNSQRSKVNAQADVYETEIYNFQRDSAEQDSRMRQFFSDRNFNGSNSFIDY